METERDATSPNGKSAVRLDAIDQCIVVLNVSPDSHVCTEVFRSLIRSRDARAVIPIVKALPRFQTLGYESESRIKKELIAFGVIAVPPLMQLCTSDKIRLRRYAVELLGELRRRRLCRRYGRRCGTRTTECGIRRCWRSSTFRLNSRSFSYCRMPRKP